MKFEPYLLLQKLALENECGIPGNPLKISWLEGFSSATDANSETVLEHSDSTRITSGGAAVESKVIITVILCSEVFHWGITAPSNNMQALKFKAQLTNFFLLLSIKCSTAPPISQLLLRTVLLSELCSTN